MLVNVASDLQGIKNEMVMLKTEVSNVKEDVDIQRTSTGAQPGSRRASTILDMRTLPLSKETIPTIASEHIVKEEDKIRTITLKSSIKLFENYNKYIHTSLDKTKTLASFITHDALKNLVDNEKNINTSLLASELTYASIYSVNNDVMKKIIANKVRPQTNEEYSKLMYVNVTEFKPAKPGKADDKDEPYEWGVKNYDKYMYPPVLTLLDEVETYDALFRLGVTAEEISYMPKLEWGKKSYPGAFRVFMQCMGPYMDGYIEYATEQKLKDLTTMSGFIMLIKECNLNIAKEAKIVREIEQRMTPVTKTGEAFSEVKNAKLQDGFKRGVEYKRNTHALKSMEPDMQYETIYEEQESFSSEDNNTLALYKSPEKPTFKNVQFKTPASNGVKTYKTEPVDNKNRACYEYARTGSCTANNACLYSHDKRVCADYLAARVAECVKSPLYKGVQSPNSSQYNTPTSRSPYTPGTQMSHVKLMEQDNLIMDEEANLMMDTEAN
jgi:hypothetical protein